MAVSQGDDQRERAGRWPAATALALDSRDLQRQRRRGCKLCGTTAPPELLCSGQPDSCQAGWPESELTGFSPRINLIFTTVTLKQY